MQVNSDTTSKDTKISSGSRVCSCILLAKTALLLTEYLLFWRGEMIAMRCLESSYVEEPIELVLGLSRTSGLWIFGKSFCKTCGGFRMFFGSGF